MDFQRPNFTIRFMFRYVLLVLRRGKHWSRYLHLWRLRHPSYLRQRSRRRRLLSCRRWPHFSSSLLRSGLPQVLRSGPQRPSPRRPSPQRPSPRQPSAAAFSTAASPRRPSPRRPSPRRPPRRPAPRRPLRGGLLCGGQVCFAPLPQRQPVLLCFSFCMPFILRNLAAAAGDSSLQQPRHHPPSTQRVCSRRHPSGAGAEPELRGLGTADRGAGTGSGCGCEQHPPIAYPADLSRPGRQSQHPQEAQAKGREALDDRLVVPSCAQYRLHAFLK